MPIANPICPKCASVDTRRLKRHGFLQVNLFPHLSLYPWECTSCRVAFNRRYRGKLKRKRREAGEPHLPPIA